MPTPSAFDIYKASAGSGKTFSLTLHYLQLALEQPVSYRSILAVTFTNKATAEMKHRILEVLQGLATRSTHRDIEQYRRQLLIRMPGSSPERIHQQAVQLYRNILHDYSRFSVSTIDAFVQRIIRSFAWELGIDGGFKLQLNPDPVKEDLASRLYQRLDDDKDLQQWVVEMAMERLADGKRWEFRDDMLKLADELFKEKFRDFEDALQDYDAGEVQQQFTSLNTELQVYLRGITKKWREEGEAMLSLIANAGLQPEDFAYGKSGFAQYFRKAVQEPMQEPGSRVREAMANTGKMVSRSSSQEVKNKAATISQPLQQALQKLERWYHEDLSRYQTAQAIKKNLSLLRIMRVFAEELAAYRRDNNALLISDTHFLLKKLTSDTNASFIYEKTGQRYQHFLIDEFQDTSCFQWSNFLPMLTEALAKGNYNLIVGDVKQAIYRWRNGDWRLLLQQVETDLHAFAPRVKTLQENYRSTRQVIAFNNHLFRTAPLLLQHELNSSLTGAPAASLKALRNRSYHSIFNDAYADSLQLQPEGIKSDGYVAIQWVPEQEDTSYEEQVLALLYQQIRQLLEEGYQPSELTVLTRTNKEAWLVVEHLVKAQQEDTLHFQVISGDALLLSGNQAVQIIICAMQWLLNSKHTIALAQLRQLMRLLQGSDANSMETFATRGDHTMLPPAFLEERARLRTLPLQGLVHELILLFGLHTHPQHTPYLLAFSDKVQEWVRYGETSLQEFVHYWNDEGISLALPANSGNNALEVVTVHKSKGLAYNIVLMPFLNWEILPAAFKAPTLWVNNRETPFNAIPVVPVKYNKKLAQSEFATDYFEELVLTAMDNLNVLYVAFTRARQRLYGWAPAKESSSRSADAFPFTHIGDLMRLAATTILAPEEGDATAPQYDAEKGIWQIGEPVFRSNPPKASASMQANVLTYTQWQQRLRIKYQALASQTEEDMVLPRRQGVLLHDILSRMQHPSQLEQALQQVQREGWMDDYQAQKVRNQLEPVLQLEALAPWHEGRLKRLAERNMVNLQRELRRPDLILYNQDTCLVYEFKFTSGDDAREKHETQVREYMTMLTQMGFRGVRGYVIYGLEKKYITIDQEASTTA